MALSAQDLDQTMQRLRKLLPEQRDDFARLAEQIDQQDLKMQALEERCRRMSHVYSERR